VLDALPSIVGGTEVWLTSAAARALRVRAAAMFSVGAPASASSIKASSCRSLKLFHQSVFGHAAFEMGTFVSTCCAASALTSRSEALGARLFMLAQPARTALTRTSAAMGMRAVISANLSISICSVASACQHVCSSH
jgi:hypothetical protein